MTPKLRALVERLTCLHCLGNGRVGGRVLTRFPGGKLYYRDDGHDCPYCDGSGIRLADTLATSVLVIGDGVGDGEVLAIRLSRYVSTTEET